jgi:hypothetical protein
MNLRLQLYGYGNIIYIAVIFILLVDVNYFLAIPALIILLYKLKIRSNPIEIGISSILFYFYIFISLILLIVGIISPSIHLLLFYMYIFKVNLHMTRDIHLSRFIGLSMTVAVAFALIQIINRELIVTFRDAISNVPIELVDYSKEPLSHFRTYGIFSNPNYFSFFVILCFALAMHISKRFFIFLSVVALIGVVISGSRAGMLSYFLLISWWSLKDQNARQFLASLVITVSLVLMYYVDADTLRIFNVADLFAGKDPSSSVRIETIDDYIASLNKSNRLITLLFGTGTFDNEGIFFDGDPGNLLYTYGVFGVIGFTFILIAKFSRARAVYLLLILLPFIFGGGVFGNLKLLFLFIFLPALMQINNIPLRRI